MECARSSAALEPWLARNSPARQSSRLHPPRSISFAWERSCPRSFASPRARPHTDLRLLTQIRFEPASKWLLFPPAHRLQNARSKLQHSKKVFARAGRWRPAEVG